MKTLLIAISTLAASMCAAPALAFDASDVNALKALGATEVHIVGSSLVADFGRGVRVVENSDRLISYLGDGTSYVSDLKSHTTQCSRQIQK